MQNNVRNEKLEIWSYGYIKNTLDDEGLKFLMAKPFFSSLLTQSMSYKNTSHDIIKNTYNKLSKNENFIPFLMPDLSHYDNAGGYYKEYLVTEKSDIINEKHNFFIDTSKIFYIYCQMHFISAQNPEKEINFTFYDNKEEILQRAHQHFSKYALDIPANITLIFNQIQVDMVVCDSLTEIKGEGQTLNFEELKNIIIDLNEVQKETKKSTFHDVVNSYTPGQVDIRKSISELIKSARDYFKKIKINNDLQESNSSNNEFLFSSPSFNQQSINEGSSDHNTQTKITPFNITSSNLSSLAQQNTIQYNSPSLDMEISQFNNQFHSNFSAPEQNITDESSTEDNSSSQVTTAQNGFSFKTFGFILAGIALATALITLMMAISIISANLTSTLWCGLASFVLGIGSGVCFINKKQPETKGFTPN